MRMFRIRFHARNKIEYWCAPAECTLWDRSAFQVPGFLTFKLPARQSCGDKRTIHAARAHRCAPIHVSEKNIYLFILDGNCGERLYFICLTYKTWIPFSFWFVCFPFPKWTLQSGCTRVSCPPTFRSHFRCNINERMYVPFGIYSSRMRLNRVFLLIIFRKRHHQQISMVTLRFDGKMNASCFAGLVFFRHLKTTTAARFVNNATASNMWNGGEREADEKAKKESHPCCMQYEWSWWTCFSFFFLLCFDLLAVHLFHERWMTDWQANNDDSVNAHIKTSLFTFYGIANEL